MTDNIERNVDIQQILGILQDEELMRAMQAGREVSKYLMNDEVQHALDSARKILETLVPILQSDSLIKAIQNSFQPKQWHINVKHSLEVMRSFGWWCISSFPMKKS